MLLGRTRPRGSLKAAAAKSIHAARFNNSYEAVSFRRLFVSKSAKNPERPFSLPGDREPYFAAAGGAAGAAAGEAAGAGAGAGDWIWEAGAGLPLAPPGGCAPAGAGFQSSSSDSRVRSWERRFMWTGDRNRPPGLCKDGFDPVMGGTGV